MTEQRSRDDLLTELNTWERASNVRREVRDLARRSAAEIKRLQSEIEQLRSPPTASHLDRGPRG